MKLLIVSNMSHYRRANQIVGWGPTVQEIDHLGVIFDEVRHIACLHDGEAPPSALPYAARNVSLVPVPPTGGNKLSDKLNILRLSALYLRTILRGLRWADVVHVRCPANTSLLAVMALMVLRRPQLRWVKYAGNWQPERSAWSYALQRWWVNKNLHRGVVTINGRWAGQPKHVHTFWNPCLTEDDVAEARRVAADKQLASPVRLIYAGRLERAKGVDRAIHVLARLQQKGLAAHFDLIGGGAQQAEFERLATDLGVRDSTTFHGWMPRPAMAPLYAQAHFMIFPSDSEGFPKVLSEAMAYGVVPIAGAVSSIPQNLAATGAGVAVPPHDIDAFADAVLDYVAHPQKWMAARDAGMTAASQFTYEYYLRAVNRIFEEGFGVDIGATKIGTATT